MCAHRIRTFALSCAGAALTALGACGNDRADDGADDANQSDASPPPQAVSFANQLQPIFNASCTSCHGVTEPAEGLPGAGLQLTAGSAYSALVGPSSTKTEQPCTAYKLVSPGQPDQSYLIWKLQGKGTCLSGSQMPRGMPALSSAQIQLFRDWIANGAPNN